MSLREVIPTLIACSCLSPIAAAQTIFPSRPTIPRSSTVEHAPDFGAVVVPITSVKFAPSVKLGITGKLGPSLGIDANFGTGFCLDAACRFIVTNYHVAMTTRAGKIKGEKIIHRYLATGSDDRGATANPLPNMDVLPFAMSRDLAILELRCKISNHLGRTFSIVDLDVGLVWYSFWD